MTRDCAAKCRLQLKARTELRQIAASEPPRRFPPPWSVEETDACYIDRNVVGPLVGGSDKSVWRQRTSSA
jgi:hypothetical protein